MNAGDALTMTHVIHSRNSRLKIALSMAFCALFSLQAFADVVHFHNGKVVRGKLSRVTGEIIEFVPEGYGRAESIQRLTLTNRHDMVETRDHRRFFGEIIYTDVFKIEMETSAGKVKVNRLMVSNVVIGTPADQPVSEELETTRQQADERIVPATLGNASASTTMAKHTTHPEPQTTAISQPAANGSMTEASQPAPRTVTLVNTTPRHSSSTATSQTASQNDNDADNIKPVSYRPANSNSSVKPGTKPVVLMPQDIPISGTATPMSAQRVNIDNEDPDTDDRMP